MITSVARLVGMEFCIGIGYYAAKKLTDKINELAIEHVGFSIKKKFRLYREARLLA